MANILNANEDYNPKNGLKNIFTKLVEIIKAVNANTSAIADLPVQPKVYKALLTQSGTSAPVETILVNTLSGTPVWSYDSIGYFIATLSGEFTIGKTIVYIGTLNNNGRDGFVKIDFQSANEIWINTSSLVAGSLVDSDAILENTPITIEVYP